MKIKKMAAWFLTFCLFAPTAFAANDAKEEDRVRDAGVVIKEILNIPDDIPQDLLDKAECVVSSGSVCAGRGEHRVPVGWASHGFCFAGDEPQGSALAAIEQSEAGSGRIGGGWSKGTDR